MYIICLFFILADTKNATLKRDKPIVTKPKTIENVTKPPVKATVKDEKSTIEPSIIVTEESAPKYINESKPKSPILAKQTSLDNKAHGDDNKIIGQ